MIDDVTNLVTPGTYKHFKGGVYEVLFCAKHSEDLSVLVVYRNSGGQIWVRPLKEFKSRMPDGTLRFTPITLDEIYANLLKEQGEESKVIVSDKVGFNHLMSISAREPIEEPCQHDEDEDGDLDDEDIREFISYEDKNTDAIIKMKLSRGDSTIYEGPGADALSKCRVIMLDDEDAEEILLTQKEDQVVIPFDSDVITPPTHPKPSVPGSLSADDCLGGGKSLRVRRSIDPSILTGKK